VQLSIPALATMVSEGRVVTGVALVFDAGHRSQHTYIVALQQPNSNKSSALLLFNFGLFRTASDKLSYTLAATSIAIRLRTAGWQFV